MANPRQEFQFQLSPWAQRFGQSSSGAWVGMDGLDHSGLAPEMPNLNETYHADDFLPAGDQTPFPMPTLAELDRLFMGEQEQTLGLGGFKTWEFGPLNNTLYGGYFGGHQMPRSMEDEVYNEIAFDEGRLVIDESKWLPWFRRDNWWENKIPDDIRKLGGRKYFSVDDDGIWNELRVCLELANRIMNTLIDERHPLMVAAVLNDVDPNAPPEERRIRLDPEDSQKMSTEELRDQITRMGEDWIISSFLPDRWNISNGNTLMGLWSLNNPQIGSNEERVGVLGMAVYRLRALVEGALTPAEKCMVQFSYAKTICHESMHALFSWHTEYGQLLRDPFINDEISREIGRSFENMIFGGHIHTAPTSRHSRTAESWTEGNMLTLLSEPFPGRGSLRYGGKPADLPEMEDTNIVPVLWVSALLSEKFWETEVAKYGSRALKMPQYVKTTRRFKNGTTFNSPETLDVDTPLDTLRDRLRTTTLDFNNRHLKWIQLRPWYQEEGFKWFISPWGVDAWRSALSNFKVAHARQDERECFREINNVMDLYQSGNKRTWLYHALGLLMSASVPLRRKRSGKEEPQQTPKDRGAKPKTTPNRQKETFHLQYAKDHIQEPSRSQSRSNPRQQAHGLAERLHELLQGPRASGPPAARVAPKPVRDAHAAPAEPAEQPCLRPLRGLGALRLQGPPYDPQWQTWDRASDGRGGMRQMLVDKDPPVSFKNTPEGNRTNLDRETQLRDRLDVDALRWFGLTDPQGSPVPYFTLTEVGSHREAGDAWIVMLNKNSLPNVWDVTEALNQLQWTTAQFRSVTRMTNIGLQPRAVNQDDDLVTAFYSSSLSWRMIGKLAIPQTEAAVRENDGTNGLPLYKTYGKEVYDLTRGPIDETLPGYYPAMVAVLSNYRCGTIMDLPSVPRPDADLRTFTARCLRWYDNPTLGVYFAVEGFVYDMSNYLESHPGGLDSLKQFAGKDASQPFNEAHATNPLLASPYDSLRIGRMVDEIPSEQIQANQVVLDSWVYNISRGQDATDILSKVDDESNPRPAKMALEALKTQHQSRVVARVEMPLPNVSLADLAEHSDPADGGAWVAIGDNVWDMASMMQQPEWYRGMGVTLVVITDYAGKVISTDDASDDEALLKDKYPHLLVAKLSGRLSEQVEDMELS
ncbi:cytochrome b5-like Heme/Steroid binding domain-containing protein [Apiospora kogelbergensis]|uniref:cytochrome b5-like Heme/Steroid binding domain-containing protein n=1 Tax=Apiospora kogelbergensis TaxID=1337665 RepID=UPI0031315E70